MDSFLSGREKVGDKPKPADKPQLGPKALGELPAPPAADSDVQDLCGSGGSSVQYVTESGRVTKIVVTCACGQITEIDCEYEE